MLWTLLALFGIYLGACFALSGTYLSPKRVLAVKPPTLVQANWGGQECFVTPKLARGEPVPVVFVLAHGLGGSRAMFSEEAEVLDRAGYGAILPPMPGQDVNTLPTVGFGVTEADLIAKIAEEARALPQKPKIVIGGVSMGGRGYVARHDEASLGLRRHHRERLHRYAPAPLTASSVGSFPARSTP